MINKPTVTEMQKAFYSHTIQRYELAAPNVFMGSIEMDLVGIRKSGFLDEVEIKLSKSDFMADFKKTTSVKDGLHPLGWPKYVNKNKHEATRDGQRCCNYFSFLLPEELVEKCEIPEYSGLYVYYIDRAGYGRIREEKTAPRLHKRKVSIELKYKISRKMTFRYWDSL